MKLMIIKAPAGFNVEEFCDIASAIVRDECNETDRRDYDYNLGDYLLVRGQPISYMVDASLIDFRYIKAFQQLQKICPAVEIYFEDASGDEDWDDGTDGCGDYFKMQDFIC